MYAYINKTLRLWNTRPLPTYSTVSDCPPVSLPQSVKIDEQRRISLQDETRYMRDGQHKRAPSNSSRIKAEGVVLLSQVATDQNQTHTTKYYVEVLIRGI